MLLNKLSSEKGKLTLCLIYESVNLPTQNSANSHTVSYIG